MVVTSGTSSTLVDTTSDTRFSVGVVGVTVVASGYSGAVVVNAVAEGSTTSSDLEGSPSSVCTLVDAISKVGVGLDSASTGGVDSMPGSVS